MANITGRQIYLVQSTWNEILPHSTYAARVFYKRLFGLNPKLKRLFKDRQEEQEEQLMSMLTMAINSLHQQDNIISTFQALGSRHQNYGVKKRDYKTFLAALLSMLKAGLRNKFSPEIQEAWSSVYNLITSYMIVDKKISLSRED